MLSVKVNRKEFLKAIQIVENAVFENKIREVISGVYIEAKDNKISLKGTDLELTINANITGEIINDGKVVIKHKLIEEFLKQISEDEIEFQEEQGKIIIKTSKTKTEFSIYNAENFPIVPGLEIGVEYEFDKEELLNDIEKVKISASLETETLAINCIRFEIEEGKLKLISSDTYRLTYMERDLAETEKGKESLSVSIPLKTIDGLVKIMKIIDQDKVTFRSDGTKVFFKFQDVEILTRVIELQFPDYKKILESAQHDKKVLLNKKDFLSVLRRTAIFVRDNREARNSGMFLFQNGKMNLTGINDNAKIQEELPIIYDGDDLKISLNVKFLIDYVSIVDGEVIEVKLYDSQSSVIVKDEKEENSIYFTMPLTLRD